jgi:hypothetical protein
MIDLRQMTDEELRAEWIAAEWLVNHTEDEEEQGLAILRQQDIECEQARRDFQDLA